MRSIRRSVPLTSILSLATLASGCLSIGAAFGQQSPPVTERRFAPALKQEPASKGAPAARGDKAGQSATATVTMRSVGRVDASHLRMHHPELVLGVARQVKAGTLPPAALDRLVGPGTRNALLAADLNAQQPRTTGPAPGGAGKQPQQPPSAPKAQGTGVSWSGLLGTLGHLGVDYSPSSLAYPAVWDGQQSVLTLHVTAPTTGPVTAGAPAGAPYRVVRMIAYDGTLRTVPGSKIATRGIAESRTAAPWTVHSVAGQDVAIDVAFQPVLNIVSMPAGDYNSTLNVDGTEYTNAGPKPWKIEVPMRGHFLGKNLGVLMLAQGSEILVYAPDSYDPTQAQNVDANIRLVNLNGTASGTIVPGPLPAGVTMDRLAITVPAGQTVDTVLHFHIDRQHGIFHGPQATYPIGVAFNYDTRQSQLGFGMTVLEYDHSWDSGDQSCLSVTYRIFYSLRPTGTSYFEGSFENKNVLTTRMDVRGTLGGERLGSMVLASDLTAFSTDQRTNPGFVPGAAQRFQYLTSLPLSLAVRCSN